jgi:hypothetical protein
MNTVFASRWKAAWWSAGVLMTAYCTVPSPDDATPPGASAVHSAAKNPWSKTATGLEATGFGAEQDGRQPKR